jgi:hypothetical protein
VSLGNQDNSSYSELWAKFSILKNIDLPAQNPWVLLELLPYTDRFFGGNQIGQVGFLQICKRSFFFERMVFEDEENGQWVVPIHMISAFLFLFLFSEQCEANQIFSVAWLLSVTLGFGKQVTQILCS